MGQLYLNSYRQHLAMNLSMLTKDELQLRQYGRPSAPILKICQKKTSFSEIKTLAFSKKGAEFGKCYKACGQKMQEHILPLSKSSDHLE